MDKIEPVVPVGKKIVEGTLSVTITVTATGKPEDAAELAEAARKATKILAPGASIVG